jgi:tetratricopeptide (TPR) repeat protein
MQNNNSFWLSVGIVLAILLAGTFFFLGPHSASAPGTIATSTGQIGSTTTTNLGNGVTVVANGSVGGEVTVTTSKSITAPSLTKATTFSASLPASQVAQLRADEATTIAALIKNSDQTNYWLQLALDYKIAGDYPGAIAVWTYLTEVTPTNYVPYADLGDLYQNFDVNYPKAEANYLQAIKLNPQDINTYSNLFTLYRYQYKTNTTAAADIVAQGLKANPNNPDLLQLQQQLQAKAQ